MKSLTFVLCALAMGLTRCNHEKVTPTKSARPPFTEFTIQTAFDLPSSTPQNFTNLSDYSSWGDMFNEFQPRMSQQEYAYDFGGTILGSLPSNAQLLITTNNGELTLEAIGTMPRVGDKIPFRFSGDPGLWGDTSLNYDLIIKADIAQKKITSASLHIDNAKFDSSYDIPTDGWQATFTENTSGNGPEWQIELFGPAGDTKTTHSLWISCNFLVNHVL